MATVNTSWTSPASATLDKATGATIDEAMMDALASNLYHLGGANGYIGCRAYTTATTSLPNATILAIAFGVEYFDHDPNGALHDTSTNNSRITIRTTGVYHIGGQGVFDSNATGYRELRFRANGVVDLLLDARTAISGSVHYCMLYGMWPLVAGDYLEMMAQQTSGGALDVSGNFGVVKA